METLIASPKLDLCEVKKFRERMCRLASNNLTNSEKSLREKRKKNMERVAKMIESKNGGKNPILEY